MRKYFVSSLIILIMAFTFCIGYFSVPQNIYADSATDQWTSVTTNQDLADAFRYYCKSRNLAVEGSVVDALTSFTTNSFNTICNTLGIDVTALQAHLKRSTDSNGKVQFLFDQFGVTAYNRIFAEFLQNNNLEVGDEVEDQTLYSGHYFVDKDGHGCLTFTFNTSDATSFQNPVVFGSPYRFSTEELMQITDFNNGYYTTECHLTDVTNWTLNSYKLNSFVSGSWTYPNVYNTSSSAASGTRWYQESYRTSNPSNIQINKRYPIIYYDIQLNKYYVGSFGINYNGNYAGSQFQVINFGSNATPQNTVIFITTNNNTINNNTYNDNRQTVINNEGDVYNYDYDDDDPPVNPPSGGGGDDPSGGDDPIDWPNITFPNILPHLQIPNLKDKFPFSIPWDLIAFYAILNVDPVCPEIETDINLGIVQWHVDLSLEDFEPAAEICRDMYFIAFCVGLIIVTRDLIRG